MLGFSMFCVCVLFVAGRGSIFGKLNRILGELCLFSWKENCMLGLQRTCSLYVSHDLGWVATVWEEEEERGQRQGTNMGPVTNSESMNLNGSFGR